MNRVRSYLPHNIIHVARSKNCTLYICVTFILIFFGLTMYRLIFPEKKHVYEMDKQNTCEVSSSMQALLQLNGTHDSKVYAYANGVENQPLFFVGNGHIGLILPGKIHADHESSPIYIKYGRTLSQAIPYYPIVKFYDGPLEEYSVLDYNRGIAEVNACYRYLYIWYQFYAHRTRPSLFVQEVEIGGRTFSSEEDQFIIDMRRHGREIKVGRYQSKKWDEKRKRILKLPSHDGKEDEYDMMGGRVLDYSSPKEDLIVCVLTKRLPESYTFQFYEKKKLIILTTVVYDRVEPKLYTEKMEKLEKLALENMLSALKLSPSELKKAHVQAWDKMWESGLSISSSKAAGVLNENSITAAVYYIQSSIPMFHQEEDPRPKQILYYAEGCYGSIHHTLEAENLWSKCNNLKAMNAIVNLWLMTLDKKGCHDLVNQGAEGVMQAMLLSFGSFEFTKNHLEMNLHPKFLHRTYDFRNIRYNYSDRINVSVDVGENNKAILFANVEGKEQKYYACDGGCQDGVVELGLHKQSFPVKLTIPFTAILYISSNKKHIEELQHTLHVKEVADAPAQEHNMIIMHKHGHYLHGLPSFFWIAICLLIIIFHLFLFKLLYNEYMNQNKYAKPSNMRHVVKYRMLK